MHLTNLKRSISELDEKESLRLILDIRKRRRFAPKKKKQTTTRVSLPKVDNTPKSKSRVRTPKKAVKPEDLSPAQLRELLNRLEKS